VITSRRSSRVQRVRDLHNRRGRERAGQFIAEGPGSVLAALHARDDSLGKANELYFTAAFLTVHPQWVAQLDQAESRGVLSHEVTDEVMAAMSTTQQAPGILAVCTRAPAQPLASVLTPRDPRAMMVCLERPNDPGNVGTIIRTADAAGAQAVATLGPSADPSNDKSVRASAGSVFHLPVLAGVQPMACVAEARHQGWTILATAADGEVDAFEWLAGQPQPQPMLWLFGNEAHGLDPELQAAADVRLRIPMVGSSESMNLAACVAVCLFAPAVLRVTGWGEVSGGN